jgi:methyl-accepting chemotaxis protein
MLIGTLFTVNNIFRSEILKQMEVSNLKLIQSYSRSLNLNNPQELIDTIIKDNPNTVYVLYSDSNLKIIATNQLNQLGDILSDENSLNCINGETIVGRFYEKSIDDYVMDVCLPIKDNGKIIGMLNIGIPIDSKTLNSMIGENLFKLAIIIVLIIVVGLVINLILFKLYIMNPIKATTKLINNEEHKPVIKNDELGLLYNEVKLYKQTIESNQETSFKISEELNGSIQEIMAVFEELSASAEVVVSSTSEVSKAIESMANDNVGLSNFFSDFSKQFESMVNNINTTSKLIDNISIAIDKSNNSMDNILVYTDESKGLAELVGKVLNKLNDISKESLELVNSTKDIASTTKLLGLNASIESARVKEHGSGFAVIAQEITHLADSASLNSDKVAKSLIEINNTVKDTLLEMDKVGMCLFNQFNSITETKSALDSITTNEGLIINSIDSLIKSLNIVQSSQAEIRVNIDSITGVSEQVSAQCEETLSTMTEVGSGMESVTVNVMDISLLAEKLIK